MNSNDFLNEDIVTDANDMHQDHEVQMARQECYHAAERAIAIHKLLRHVNEAEGLEGWVSAKITLANDYLKTVNDYLEYQLMTMNSPAESEMLPIAESQQGVAEVREREKMGKELIIRTMASPANSPALKNILLSHIDEVREFVATGEMDQTSGLFQELYEYFANSIPVAIRRDPFRLGRRIQNLIAPAAKFYVDARNMNEQGVAEGMFTKGPTKVPAIDPIIGKQINNIINKLHYHTKQTKDEYLRAAVREAAQELFVILRNTGGTYSPPGSPGVRDVAEDASAGASSNGSVATVVKGGKGGTNLLGGPKYKGPNPFKKKKSK